MPNITRHTSLSANLVAFCRYLRQNQFAIGPEEEKDALSAIEVLKAVSKPDLFREGLKAVFAKSSKERHQFDTLYSEYWKELGKGVDSKIKHSDKATEKQGSPPRKRPPSLIELKSWLYGNKTMEQEEIAVYSPGEVLNRKDLTAFPRKGVEELIRIIYSIAKVMATRNNRRYRFSRSPGTFDLRKTIRHNLRQGGEIINLAYRKPQRKRLKIVLLCDVSRSMDLYSRFMIRFMYAFQYAYRNIETFVFSTALQRITKQLDQDNFDEALKKMSEEVNQWSGGTRIGSCLETFVDEYASRMLDHRTITLIISDGMDTGDADVLEQSMASIKRRSAYVIWLNPLAGRPGYKPEVKGMKTALPYVDLFTGVHDAETLRDALKGFGRKRLGYTQNLMERGCSGSTRIFIYTSKNDKIIF